MKIIEYNIIDEANQDLLKHISNIDSKIAGMKGLSKITPSKPEEEKVEKDQYRYNTNKLTFTLKSSNGYNKFDSRAVTATYTLFNNTLQIITKNGQNKLNIYFDYVNELTELVKNVEYKVKDIDGRFQNVNGTEDFDSFTLLTPDKILKSVKIGGKDVSSDKEKGSGASYQFKPNSEVDFVLNHKGKTISIKGLAHLEAQVGGNKYKFINNDLNFIFTTDKPLINRSNVKYVIKRMSGKDKEMPFDTYDVELVVNSLKYL